MIKASETIDQEATTARLLAHLWRGGAFGYYWTPDGERYVKDGKERQAKNSYWTRTQAAAINLVGAQSLFWRAPDNHETS